MSNAKVSSLPGFGTLSRFSGPAAVLLTLGGLAFAQRGHPVAADEFKVVGADLKSSGPPTLKRTPSAVHAIASLATGRLCRLGESGPCDHATAVLVKTPSELEQLLPANTVLLATAAHVAYNESGKHVYEIELFEQSEDGKPAKKSLTKIRAKLLAYSQGLGLPHGLAFLAGQLPEDPVLRSKISSRCAVISGREQVERFEPITSIGFPDGNPTMKQHHLIRFQGSDNLCLLTSSVQKGHSGAGLFDDNGQLVGIVSGTYVTDGKGLDFNLEELTSYRIYYPELTDPAAKEAQRRRIDSLRAETNLKLTRQLVPPEIVREPGRTTATNVVAIGATITKIRDSWLQARTNFNDVFTEQQRLYNALITPSTPEATKMLLRRQLGLALKEQAEGLFNSVGGIPPQESELIKQFSE